ncbi:hypothetical protein ABKN59_005155 [Abortiporus biennis]
MPTPVIFTVDDIRTYLFEIIAPYDKVYWWDKCPDFYRSRGHQRFSDIAHFGFTCKIICDHALDYLWYHLHDLKQLLVILPMFKVEESTGENGKRVVKGSLTGPIQAEYWDRLQHYARRVRRAYCGRDGIETSVFEELLVWSGGKGIFDNMERVDWEEDAFLHREPIVFMNSKVTRLTLRARWHAYRLPYVTDSRTQSETDEIQLFQSIKKYLPALQYLFIEDLTVSVSALQLTTDLVDIKGICYARLNQCVEPADESGFELDSLDGILASEFLSFPLRTHEMLHFTMDPDFFSQIARLKKLEFLTLNVDGLEYTDQVWHLPLLKMMNLYGRSSERAKFMRHLSAPRLEDLCLLPEDMDLLVDDWTDLSECTEVIGERFSDELHTVLLERMKFKHKGPIGVSLMTVIKPLFKLQNLKDLEITAGDDLCLSDDEVLAIFQSCRKLRSLQIPYIAGLTQPTPLCIEHAVKYAPQLWRWRIDLNFSHAPGSLRSIQVIHPSICRLNFIMRHLPIESDIDPIATEIYRMFPSLDVEATVTEGNHVVWRNVLRKVADLQGAIVSYWVEDKN